MPIDGQAPENTGGPAQLVSLSGVPCTLASTGICFQRIPAVGADGNLTPLPNFLGISSVPVPNAFLGVANDHFDSDQGMVTVAAAGPVSSVPTAEGLQVYFKLDPRLTDGVQLGERWGSPAIYDTVQSGIEFIAEARAVHVDGGSETILPDAVWTPDDPGMVSVSPGQKAGEVTITVHGAGRSTLQVSAQGETTTVYIAAAYKTVACDSLRVAFSKTPDIPEFGSETCQSLLPSVTR